MKQQGIVSQALLWGLLGYGGNEGSCEALTGLMLRYGLLVLRKLRDTDKVTYLVPALFPSDPSVLNKIDTPWDQQVWADGQPVTTLFIVFSLHETVLSSCLSVRQLPEKCFLPSGLFDRLVCALLKWSQQYLDVDPSTFRLFKNDVVMKIANVAFRLVRRSDSNCIELNTQLGTPVTLMRRLESVLTRLIQESIQSLYLQSVVRTENYLLPAKVCMEFKSKCVFKMFDDGGEVHVDSTAVGQQHPWLWATVSTKSFDVFLSRRWGAPDDELVASLFDQLSDYIVNDQPVSLFYDARHMKDGHRFDQEFFNALLRSSVMVPPVSVDILQG
jgi:hypothetical protein